MSKHLDPQYPLWECLSICSLKEKEVKKFRERGGSWEGLEGGKERGKCSNYIIISKNKNIIKKR